MNNSKNRNNDSLGVNKMGKNIRKSPLHQPNFSNNAARQQPQPQVYNISKNDFRDIVQQLTGSPSHHSQDHPPRPPNNPPKPQSMRLQKIRPPPLTPINRPHMPPQMPVYTAPPPMPYNNAIPRLPAQFGQLSPNPLQPLTPGDLWANTAESPISAYMRYLQNSMNEPSPWGNQVHPQPHPHPQSQVPGNVRPQPPSSALLPNPPIPAFPSPRFNGPIQRMNANNHLSMPNLPSPQTGGPPPLLSPTSQFLMASPTGYMNLLSPRSPYPLLSPGIQFPSPLTPGFPFSPIAQSGIFGPGPQHPQSPGIMFPSSPSGFFPMPSPRWRDH
ncbi:PREDICTED: protein HAIKU1-like isoform X2 [Lupinus angustifolius]|uniref:protein HAIKU1-like isoform X2 n=1 Tax=Lupinus angustifolius TaxID=3871 RepID=UPI00092F5355|nr:PREDICTED: protein HAIKU1-like isoform X2 [Lupinus angustifolius]